jgi:ribose 5-phosphate isomerase A
MLQGDSSMDSKELKVVLGRTAADALVHDNMKLGLGTGSTAVEAVKRIGELYKAGKLRNIICVATSFQAELECYTLGIPIYSLNDPLVGGRLDLTIDGADEVDDKWLLIKGGGGAFLMEKIIACYSEAYAIVVEERKLVRNIGSNFPIPVEVYPDAYLPVQKRLAELGGAVTIRQGEKFAGPAITKQGNIILDVAFAEEIDPISMEKKINEIVGVAENGIFTRKVTDLFIGHADGRIEHKKGK